MPIFEYSCRRCEHRFEKVQKSQDAAEVICPHCGSDDVKKELSSFATGSGGGASSHSCAPGGG
ncbi:FmdB family zinc ribbon protein [Geomesophilobacter sediminis]|uniref:Zinc ribbon domain-containing protein n=1 Tax=Geomesophilobacter sediminis TaxID=2798584 RepID=A0A8J7M329_9BACT|nr:zinc ribbon domain-containing protein [Geomesophilobacter sediminis]MBJ6727737.1 zinc ribbon domain-containing protein [Geomesophilobacter sediminis]